MLRKLLVITFGIILPLILIIATFVGYNWVFDSNVNLKDAQTFEVFVYPEDSPQSILVQLEEAKIIKNRQSFILVAQQKKWQTAKSGRYIVKAGMSNNELINMFRAGLQTPVNLTINQVETLAQVAGSCGKQLMADSTDIYNAFFDADFLRENNLTPETAHSIIIQNTYESYWNISAKALREKLLKEYNSFWNENRIALAKNLKLSKLEVSNLAAIVEKETAKYDEMPVVAGLYLNRLRIGMALQSDPTVIYAKYLRDGKGIEIRRVLHEDLKIDSPYNTYMYAGLPPSPVTIPSIQAIDAVLHANKNDYIYMCADPERMGYHSFAKNYDQHLANARKYQKFLNDNQTMR